MAKFFKNEDTVEKFSTREQMQEFLDFRAKHDKWLMPRVNECGIIGIPNAPIVWDFYTKEITSTLRKSGYRYSLPLPHINMESEDNLTCVTAGPGIFLITPVNSKFYVLPVANFAYADVCARGGDLGSVMLRQDSTRSRQALPVEEKAARLTRDFTLVDEQCKILYRDHMVCAMHSDTYVVVPMHSCIAKVEESLKKHFPDYTFREGCASHFYLFAEYLLNDEISEGRCSELLEKAGIKNDKVKAGLIFYTSDIGESSVTASMYYTVGAMKLLLGKSVKMPHKGEASAEKFAEALENMGQLFKDGEERIEELGNTPIAHPAEVLLAIREKNTWLPKAITEDLAETLKGLTDTTAIDVYLALNEAIELKKQKENPAPEIYINLCEQVARLLYLPYSRIDAGEEWN